MIVSGRYSRVLVCIILLAVTFSFVFQAQSVYAAQIQDRSLTLQAGTTDGGSKPSGSVKHKFDFTLPGGNTVGSIQFLYCTTAGGSCTKPTGLTTTSAALDAQTGVTGFTIVNTTDGAPYLTRTAAAIGTNIVTSYTMSNITNPSAANTSFYVRITGYSSEDATTGAGDIGVVAASTATQIVLTGTMPESLIFCTGETVSTTGGVPDCSTATAGAIAFNQLFSPTDTATTTSQMAASTNAGAGYAISVNGPTMTSGSNTITAMASETTSVHGVSQFGLNLMNNADPDVGADVTPAANGTNYRGQALTGYGTADTFKFVTGGTVADSANGGAGGTDAQIFTASYIVNVSGSQAAGTYTTTLTYICTATF